MRMPGWPSILLICCTEVQLVLRPKEQSSRFDFRTQNICSAIVKKKKRQQKNTNKNYPYRAVKLLCIPLTKDENLFKLNTTLMKTRHLHSQTNAFSLTAIVCH